MALLKRDNGVMSVGCNADGSSGSQDWGNAEVLRLTKNGTGNNAFPAFSSDGSEVGTHRRPPMRRDGQT